jgi:hypothetical protein
MNAHCTLELKLGVFFCAPAFRGRTSIVTGEDAPEEAEFAFLAEHHGYAFSVCRRRLDALGALPEQSAVGDRLRSVNDSGEDA